MELEPLLTAEQVAARYALRDLATARRIMRAAGGFKIAGRLFVRVGDLVAYEAAQSGDAGDDAEPAVPPTRREERRASTPENATPSAVELPLGWWRSDATGA